MQCHGTFWLFMMQQMQSFQVVLLQAAPAVQAASESALDLSALLAQKQANQPAVPEEQKAAAAAQPTKDALQEVRCFAAAIEEIKAALSGAS